MKKCMHTGEVYDPGLNHILAVLIFLMVAGAVALLAFAEDWTAAMHAIRLLAIC